MSKQITLTVPWFGQVKMDEADAPLFRLLGELGIAAIPAPSPPGSKANDSVQMHVLDVGTFERFLEIVANNLAATVKDRHYHPVYKALNRLNGPHEWLYVARPCDVSEHDESLPAKFKTFLTLSFPRAHLPAVLMALERAVKIASVQVVAPDNYNAGTFRADC